MHSIFVVWYIYRAHNLCGGYSPLLATMHVCVILLMVKLIVFQLSMHPSNRIWLIEYK